MTPERWQRVKEVYQFLLELDPRERAAFLDEVCAGDEVLRQDVESLLASPEKSISFMESPPVEAATEVLLKDRPPAVVGRRIGPYKLIRELGQGGMGAVYLAVRADEQFQKRVAIKLIRRDMDSGEILRRFRNERQILASLDHLHIAKLLDGGTTEDGLSYFVMEYIEGQPLTEYCDTHKLATVERLKLFRLVCSAVHYAHQNLVVHRDIKPSNILLTADGIPKLLDFGIAKLLNPELSSQTMAVTATGLGPMTLEYASPEQVRGEPITTASDVYSLGVLLYELLTGHRPYHVPSRQPHEIARAICEEDPEKPSTAISRVQEVPGTDGTTPVTLTPEAVSKTREGQPEKLRRRLAGDLDNIVLMAVRKEPQRRYRSVEQLSEDIRRHLEGLPVIARKDTFGYRAEKFIKRHKLGVMAAALVVVVLVGGIVTTTWQARVAEVERARAERRFNDVRKLANSFLFEFHDAIKNLPGATPARELVVKRALEYLDSLAQEASHDSSLRRELATAYEKVGDVQGNPYGANLGNTTGALESYRKALAIREALAAADPTNVEARRDLAGSYNRIGDMLVELTGDLTGALGHYRKALAIREALAAADPTNAKARHDLAQSHDDIGYTLMKTGDLTGALENHRKALAINEALAAADPTNVEARRGVAVNYTKIGDVLGLNNDATGALESYHKALAIFEALAAADPTNAKARRELANSYDNVGNILWATNDLAGALEQYRQSLAIREALAAADPTNAQARRDLAISYGNVGNTLAWMGDATGALESTRQSVTVFEALAATDPTRAEARRDLALAYSNLGEVYATLASNAPAPVDKQIERWREARSWYQRSLDIWLNMRARGMLSGLDASKPEKAASEIAKCDAALAKLKGK